MTVYVVCDRNACEARIRSVRRGRVPWRIGNTDVSVFFFGTAAAFFNRMWRPTVGPESGPLFWARNQDTYYHCAMAWVPCPGLPAAWRPGPRSAAPGERHEHYSRASARRAQKAGGRGDRCSQRQEGWRSQKAMPPASTSCATSTLAHFTSCVGPVQHTL